MPGDFIDIRDARFARLVHGNAGIDKLWTGGRWAEGPAYFPAGKYLIWSDIPNDRLMRWDETSGPRLGLRAALPQPERPHRRPPRAGLSPASTAAAASAASSRTAAGLSSPTASTASG